MRVKYRRKLDKLESILHVVPIAVSADLIHNLVSRTRREAMHVPQLRNNWYMAEPEWISWAGSVYPQVYDAFIDPLVGWTPYLIEEESYVNGLGIRLSDEITR